MDTDLFEKFKSGYTNKDDMPVLIVQANPTKADIDFILMLTNGRGSCILAVTPDGQMHFAPGYTPTQQAAAFQQAINMAVQRAVFPLLPEPDCVQVIEVEK